jgi:hypothetical protein
MTVVIDRVFVRNNWTRVEQVLDGIIRVSEHVSLVFTLADDFLEVWTLFLLLFLLLLFLSSDHVGLSVRGQFHFVFFRSENNVGTLDCYLQLFLG